MKSAMSHYLGQSVDVEIAPLIDKEHFIRSHFIMSDFQLDCCPIIT